MCQSFCVQFRISTSLNEHTPNKQPLLACHKTKNGESLHRAMDENGTNKNKKVFLRELSGEMQKEVPDERLYDFGAIDSESWLGAVVAVGCRRCTLIQFQRCNCQSALLKSLRSPVLIGIHCFVAKQTRQKDNYDGARSVHRTIYNFNNPQFVLSSLRFIRRLSEPCASCIICGEIEMKLSSTVVVVACERVRVRTWMTNCIRFRNRQTPPRPLLVRVQWRTREQCSFSERCKRFVLARHPASRQRQ